MINESCSPEFHNVGINLEGVFEEDEISFIKKVECFLME